MGASGSAIIADRGSLTMEANLESSTTSEHPDSQFQSIENDELIKVLAQELENLVISCKNDNQFFDRDIDKDEVDQNEVKRAIDDEIQVMEVKDDVFEAESSRENGAKKVLEDDLNECRVSEELIGDASEIGGQNYVNEVNDGVNEEYLKENYEIEIKNGDYSGEIRVYGWSDDGNEAGDLEHMTENAGGGENPAGDYSGEIGCYGWSDDGNEAGDVKHMTANAGGGEIGCYGWSDDEHMTENAGGDWSSENPGGDWGTSGGGGGLVNVVPYDDDDDDGRMKSYQYSLRPDAEDCSYYIRTGMCKYGSNCKFNHPLKKRNQPNREIKKRREDNNHMERPGQIECKYYVTTGGCKYGNACKYNHGRRGKTVITPVLEYNFVGLPIRPGEKECPYYMCNGSCKYGSSCRFNHPDPTAVGEYDSHPPTTYGNDGHVPLQNTSQPIRQGEKECPYYMRNGSCKYGSSCRFNHPDPTAVGEYDSHPPTTYGNDGHVPLQNTSQPIRPGEKECPYYMRNGSCKYGSSCRFNHPDPTAVGEYDSHPPTTYGNGGHVPLQNTSQPNMANMTNMPSWSAPRTPDPTAAFVPMMYAPTQNIPPPNSDWNGYQAPVPAAAHVYPSSERGLPIPPAYFLNPPGDTNVYTQHQQQQMLVSDYPERPGQPECSYFMKTGDCKYRSGCKFHHPKNCIARTTPSVLSDKGLPLRPDQNICSHYSRYGICKYGPACKYDHPVNYSHSAGEGGFR